MECWFVPHRNCCLRPLLRAVLHVNGQAMKLTDGANRHSHTKEDAGEHPFRTPALIERHRDPANHGGDQAQPASNRRGEPLLRFRNVVQRTNEIDHAPEKSGQIRSRRWCCGPDVRLADDLSHGAVFSPHIDRQTGIKRGISPYSETRSVPAGSGSLPEEADRRPLDSKSMAMPNLPKAADGRGPRSVREQVRRTTVQGLSAFELSEHHFSHPPQERARRSDMRALPSRIGV